MLKDVCKYLLAIFLSLLSPDKFHNNSSN
jgi:hypothetical protein